MCGRLGLLARQPRTALFGTLKSRASRRPDQCDSDQEGRREQGVMVIFQDRLRTERDQNQRWTSLEHRDGTQRAIITCIVNTVRDRLSIGFRDWGFGILEQGEKFTPSALKSS